MPTSIPHQKLCFYHLPTRGRVGIKLGDAWYVSNASNIFDCSMLLYYLFWMFMGFTLHFYIIFGTNLLTGGPAQICCFMPISVFRGKGISDGVKTERNQLEKLFFKGNLPDRLGLYVRRYGSWPRGWGARPPPGGAPGTLMAASFVAWRPLQVSWFAFVPERSLPKVSSRLDSVWYSFSSKH